MDKIIKLKPYYVEKVWGYEKWILSTHKNGYSFIDGKEENLFEYLGKELPILIKEIKANDALSVQVHPFDEYAQKHENDNGKTECWYIVEADDDASLICGIKDGLDREKFLEILNSGNDIEGFLNREYVKKGDMIYIQAGTVHAIDKGIKLIEIQQCSDVTYRIYDWGRDREVHINKALDVINFNGDEKSGKIEQFEILNTPYFVVGKILVSDVYRDNSKDKFNVYVCLSGDGIILDNFGNEISINQGETLYIFQNVDYTIKGKLELLKIY